MDECRECGAPVEFNEFSVWDFGLCTDCAEREDAERRQRRRAERESEAARVADALARCIVPIVSDQGKQGQGAAWVAQNAVEHRCPDDTWGSGRRHCLFCTYPYCDCGEHHATITSQRGAPEGQHGAVYQCHRCGARFPVFYPSAAYGDLQRVRHNRAPAAGGPAGE